MNQTGIFNVLDNGMAVNNSGSVNGLALQNLINMLINPSGPTEGNGGTISFPSVGTFPIAGPIKVTIPTGSGYNPAALRFIGTGQQTIDTVNLEVSNNMDLFVIDNNAEGNDNNIGGIVFQDMSMRYAVGQTSGAAIHVVNKGQNVRVFRCVFIDCPQAVYFEATLQCSMLECSCTYPNNPAVSCVTIGGQGGVTGDGAVETYIAGCLFRSQEYSSGVGITVGNVEHLRVMNTRVEAFQQGIIIAPGYVAGSNARKLFFGNVSCFPQSTVTTTGAAVLIQPTGGQSVTQAWFSHCEFTAPDGGTAYGGAGVILDPINGAMGGGLIDQIRFDDCFVCQWLGPGLSVLGGTNIEIKGGYYSANGNLGTVVPFPGISVKASGVRIIGAACNNSILVGTSYVPAVQSYGIEVQSGATDIFVRGCDLRGNLHAPLFVLGTPANGQVQVTDCAGYNDQATTLTATPPGGGSTISGARYGYYGPIAFYVSGGTGPIVTIDGNSTGLPSGGFTLSPGETASITYSGTPTFVVVGK